MLNALNHLTLAVSNLPASITFWRDLLGLRLHAEWHTGAYLTCGDFWLCLSYDETRQFIPPQNSDYTHYAFSVEPEHFDAVAQKLKDAGVTVWKRTKAKGRRSIFSTRTGTNWNCMWAIWLRVWRPIGRNLTREWFLRQRKRNGKPARQTGVCGVITSQIDGSSPFSGSPRTG